MFRRWIDDESGAITTDWVALTSALVVVGIATIYSLFFYGWDPVTDRVNAQIESGSSELCNGNMTDCYVISK